jgi:uncharacterized membrane protein
VLNGRTMTGPGPDSEVGESSGATDAPETTEGVDPTTLRAASWGRAARAITIGSLIGCALVAWAQFSVSARWVTRFVVENDLEMAQRMRLIGSCLVGLVVGAGIVGATLLLGRKRTAWVARVERVMWFLSPLMLAPVLPMVFRYKPWRDRHEPLLVVVLATTVVLEVLLGKSLRSVPDVLSRGFQWLRLKLPELIRRHAPLVIVLSAAFGYAIFMSFYHVRWHMKLQTHSFDLGIVNNLVYGGLEGRFMESPIVFGGDPKKYLATHAKYGSYLFLPIYALVPRPETMIVIQSTSLGLSAIPLFFFARRRLSDWVACALAIAWVCYYPMQSANFYDVHEVPIASFFILATIWAVDAKRWVLFGLAFAAAMLMREDMPIGMAVTGAFLLLTGHRPIAGLIMTVVALVWFVFLRFYVMDSVGDWWFPDMYKGLWAGGEKGFKSVLKTLLSNPLFVLSKVVESKKIYYLLHLLVPIAFLPARRWYLWAAFVPGAILTLLVTSYEPIFMFSFHYVMHWAPYLFAAAALALAAIGQSVDEGPARMRAAVGGMLFASIVLTYNYGAFPQRPGTFKGGYFAIDFNYSDAERARRARLYELIAMIPASASVVTSENVGPHLSSRRDIYSLRQNTWKAEWLLASSKELNLDRTRQTITRAIKEGEYGVIRRSGDFVLMKRGHDTSQNEQLASDWGL